MNLAQLRTAVDRRTRLSVDPVAATEWINEAHAAICAEHDWPWLKTLTTFATVAGTDTYAPPADWLRTIGLKVDNDEPMVWRSRSSLDDNWPSVVAGTPREFNVEASSIVVRPVPDAIVTVTHRYVATPVDLVADADTPAMPALFHGAIVEAAAALVLRSAGQSVRSAEATAAAAKWGERMLDDARRQAGPAKVRVRVRR